MQRAFALVFTALVLANSAPPVLGEERTWTSTDGRTIEAELVEATGDGVRLRRSDGKSVTVPLNMLSKTDRDWVAAKKASAEAESRRLKGLTDGPYADAIKGEWVKLPADKHGLVYQFYAGREVKRGKDGALFPLFVQLHGAAGRSDDVDTGKVEIGAQVLANQYYEKHPCFICVPLCPPDVQWGAQKEELEAIIDDLVANLPIDRDRIYLSGYSMGAGGIGSLISSRPKDYAGAIFADGQPKDDWPGKIETNLWFYMSGERDSKDFDAIAEEFKAAGTEMRFTVFPEAEHNGIHWKLAKEPTVYDWLFEQKRGS